MPALPLVGKWPAPQCDANIFIGIIININIVSVHPRLGSVVIGLGEWP